MSDHYIAPPTMALTKVTTTVTGERVNFRKVRGQEYDGLVTTMGLPDRVHVSLVGEMNSNGYQLPTGKVTSLPVATCENCFMPLNSENEAMHDGDGSSDPSVCLEYAEDVNGPHIPKPIPLAWANSASINLDSEKDSIQVSISAGDPRGGFTMEIRREWCGDPCTEDCHIQSLQRPGTTGESVDDWDTQYHLDGKLCPTCGGTGTINGRWELRMSLPNPEDGWLHMPMTDLNGRHSYYKLGY